MGVKYGTSKDAERSSQLIAARLELIKSSLDLNLRSSAVIATRASSIRSSLKSSAAIGGYEEAVAVLLLPAFDACSFDSLASAEAFKDSLIKATAENRSPATLSLVSSVNHDLGYIVGALQASQSLAAHCRSLSVLLDKEVQSSKDTEHLRQLLKLRDDPATMRAELEDIVQLWRSRADRDYAELKVAGALVASPHVHTIVLVENEQSWVDNVMNEVIAPLRTTHSFDFRTFANSADALEWLESNKAQARNALAICDLSIPELAGGKANPANGRNVVETFVHTMPAIVLSTFGSLFDEIVALGHPAVDFIEKGGSAEDPDQWATYLEARIRGYLEPRQMADCILEALEFTGTTVVFNGIEITLSDAEFAMVSALCSDRPTNWIPRMPVEGMESIAQELNIAAEDLASAIRLWNDAYRPTSASHNECTVSELCKRMILGAFSTLDPVVWRSPEKAMERIKEHLASFRLKLNNAISNLGLPTPTGALYEIAKPIPLGDERTAQVTDEQSDPTETEGKNSATTGDEIVRLTPRSGTITSAYEYTKRRARRATSNQYAVLVVEDDPEYSSLALSTLRRIGFPNLDSAADRREADKKLSTHDYDLVVLDIELPGEHGENPSVEEGILLRQVTSGVGVPVVFFSAHGREESAARLQRAAGASEIWESLLRRRNQQYVQKHGILEQDIARLVREVSRAYQDFRLCTWSPSTSYPTFCLSDLLSPKSLVSQLCDPSNPISSYVRSRMPESARSLLSKQNGKKSPSQEIKQHIVAVLNDMINDPHLCKIPCLSDAPIPAGLAELLSKPLHGSELARANRLLLELFFSTEFLQETVLHRVEIPSLLSSVCNYFWVDGVQIHLPDGGPYTSTVQIRALKLLHLLGTHDNMWMHVNILAWQMVMQGAFPAHSDASDYKQMLDRCIGALNKALLTAGIKPDDIVQSRGKSYRLQGLVSYRKE